MVSKFMPVNVSIDGVRALVVGGGAVALRKIDNLLDYSCDLTVVAPEVDEKIAYYAESGKITWEKRTYKPAEASSYGLEAAGVLVNVVDNPKLCSFTFPALIRRESLSIAISTDGKAPFLAAYLRLFLEDLFPKLWARIAKLAGKFRRMVVEKYGDDKAKKEACFSRFLSADWKTIIKKKNDEELIEELEGLLEE
jgi:siroheme synthase (precorrin-2 oxidase/ferrochelatase)